MLRHRLTISCHSPFSAKSQHGSCSDNLAVRTTNPGSVPKIASGTGGVDHASRAFAFGHPRKSANARVHASMSGSLVSWL